MTDHTNRFEEIIKQTQLAFIADSIGKIADIQKHLEQWQSAELSQESLVHITYRHVHAMKGLASTLSYHQLNQVCDEIISLILQREDLDWTSAEMTILQSLIERLRICIDESI